MIDDLSIAMLNLTMRKLVGINYKVKDFYMIDHRC